VIHYEYPLSERIRTLLRLEDLFERYAAYLDTPTPSSHQAALLCLFEITEVSSRADLKSDLLQELDRQKAVLAALRGHPDVQGGRLEDVLSLIEAVHLGLYRLPGKMGQHIREDEWLMAIKQRSVIPGGLCEFDLPGYHYWLHQSDALRTQQLLDWLAPFVLIRTAVNVILQLLRESGTAELQQASDGVFQKMLEGRNPLLIRISLAEGLACVPEISANKYALNVRFIHAASGQPRVCTDEAVPFQLTFYTL
jgi:cell division protein ZapD